MVGYPAGFEIACSPIAGSSNPIPSSELPKLIIIPSSAGRGKGMLKPNIIKRRTIRIWNRTVAAIPFALLAVIVICYCSFFIGWVAKTSLYPLSLAIFITLTTSSIGTDLSTCSAMVGSFSPFIFC